MVGLIMSVKSLIINNLRLTEPAWNLRFRGLNCKAKAPFFVAESRIQRLPQFSSGALQFALRSLYAGVGRGQSNGVWFALQRRRGDVFGLGAQQFVTVLGHA